MFISVNIIRYIAQRLAINMHLNFVSVVSGDLIKNRPHAFSKFLLMGDL